MKYLKIKHLLIVAGILLLASCNATKPIRQAEKTLKGNWTLTTVSYSRPGTFDVKLYNDASATCFENSNWQFVPNNNTATYQFSNAGCDTAVRKVKWTIPVPDGDSFSFLMKPLDEKGKSYEGNEGFRTGLRTLTEDTMVWTQKLRLEGKPFKITMNFTKNQ